MEFIAIALTSFLVLSRIFQYLKPEVSMVIASGSAGTWFLFGYIMYMVRWSNRSWGIVALHSTTI